MVHQLRQLTLFGTLLRLLRIHSEIPQSDRLPCHGNKLNTARSGRRDQRGLIVWKQFKSQLSEKELQEEVLNLENEGFQVVAVRNSQTVIVAVTSEGLAYSTSRLLKVGYEWERLMETHNQLNAIAQIFVKT